MKLLRKLGAGALAGAVGTAAMDLLLYARSSRDGGKDSLGVGSSPATSRVGTKPPRRGSSDGRHCVN